MKAFAYQEVHSYGDGSTRVYYVLRNGLIREFKTGVHETTLTDKTRFRNLLEEEKSKGVKIVGRVPRGKRLNEYLDYIPIEGGEGRIRAIVERKPFYI